MDSVICPRLPVGVYYADKKEDAEEAQELISLFRRQAFRVHDLGRFRDPERVEDADVVLVLCTPDLNSCGNLSRLAQDPLFLRALESKTCLRAVLHGSLEESSPAWLSGPIMDCRPTGSYRHPGIRYAEIPIGHYLRRLELSKLKSAFPGDGTKVLCMDYISVYRRSKQERYILDQRTDEVFVRVFLAIGEKNPVWCYPEWIVYEDPDFFLPDSRGMMTLKMARVGKRDLQRTSRNFGAYYLEKPVDVRIPEDVLYRNDRAEWARISISKLKQVAGAGRDYQETDLSALYTMDMELDPVFDRDEMTRDELVQSDQMAMMEAVNRWMKTL